MRPLHQPHKIHRVKAQSARPLAPLALVQLALVGCLAPRPSTIELGGEPAIVLKTVNIATQTPFYAAFAHHAWFDLRRKNDEVWMRLEVNHGLVALLLHEDRALEDERWGQPVRVLASWHGEEAARAIPALLDAARLQIDPSDTRTRSALTEPAEAGPTSASIGLADHTWYLDYEGWPGPNSNTFIARLLEEVPELRSELDHNSVGKDWVEGARVGRTDGGLGVEVDATYLGAAAGLRQGLELRLIGLTAGVSLWPPALKVPFLPRIGVHPGWVHARW